MAATVPTLDTERIRDANIRYHDAAARGYDSKWAIDFGEIGAGQVLGKLSKALGRRPGRYARALEIGAGTGYFSLNLARQGVIGHAVATDISPGMLERLAQTAQELGVDVDTRQADAESLPFPDGSFDLVLGHAVLHHLPGLDRALAEFHRVLAPGGTLAFMGEPSAHGDRLAAMPKRLGALLEPAWRRAMRATPTAERRIGTARRGDLRRPRGARRRAHVHARRPAGARARAPASPTCACRGRSCWRTSMAGSCAGSRPTSTRPPCRLPGTASHSAATWRSSGSTASCSSHGSRPSSSTTC